MNNNHVLWADAIHFGVEAGLSRASLANAHVPTDFIGWASLVVGHGELHIVVLDTRGRISRGLIHPIGRYTGDVIDLVGTA